MFLGNKSVVNSSFSSLGDKRPIVRMVPYQPHCFAFGGFELQMINALAAIRAEGIDASEMDFWSQDDKFDILHIWGWSVAHWPAVYWAKKHGKRVVMSALLPYPSIGYQARWYASSKCGIGKLEREILDNIDCLSVVNDGQAQTATRILHIPESKVVVIPNIVDAKYYDPSPLLLPPNNISNYVLCTGNISPRKNQLALAEACISADLPLLVIGGLVAGDEVYGASLSKLTHDHSLVKWWKKMEPGSDALLAAYQHCSVFALPSQNETQPISLLEASAIQKPLLVANKDYAKQKYFSNALRVDPNSVGDIRSGLQKIISNVDAYITPRKVIEECRISRVGLAYRNLFENLMQ